LEHNSALASERRTPHGCVRHSHNKLGTSSFDLVSKFNQRVRILDLFPFSPQLIFIVFVINLSYEGVDIKDFTNSWRDGLAFNALIHKYRPHLLNYKDLLKKNKSLSSSKFAELNLEHAFNLAKRELQIERLLDIEGCEKDF